MKKFTIILIFFLCCNYSFSQKNYTLSNYVISNVGDEYQYKNLSKDGKSPIIVGISEEIEFEGIQTHKRFENNGDYRLQTIDDKGLTIYWLYFIGNRVITYKKPIVQMPPVVTVGEIYKTETKYKYLDKGELKDEGIQTYEVKVLGLEDVKLGDSTIKNCLIIVTKALRIDKTGKQKGYELKEWYAKDVGPVKITGTIYWNDINGARTRTFTVDAELEKATVKGKEINY